MLDMGFGPQIEMILSRTPKQKHSSLWSATFPKEIRNLAYSLCDGSRNPIHFSIGSHSPDSLRPNSNIHLTVDVVETDEERRVGLLTLMDQLKGGKSIVFTTTKIMCEYVCRELRYENFNALAIHGDKHQLERDFVISEFRSGNIPILIATDVASRGLDIKDVSLVVNFEMPNQIQDFIHRVGRTGRLGGSCAMARAHTFFAKRDARFAKSFIKLLQDANQIVPEKLFEIERLYSENLLTSHVRGGIVKFGPNLSGSNAIPISETARRRNRAYSSTEASTVSCSSGCSVHRDSPDYLEQIESVVDINQKIENNLPKKRSRSRSPDFESLVRI